MYQKSSAMSAALCMSVPLYGMALLRASEDTLLWMTLTKRDPLRVQTLFQDEE
jgi:hypothetical protein